MGEHGYLSVAGGAGGSSLTGAERIIATAPSTSTLTVDFMCLIELDIWNDDDDDQGCIGIASSDDTSRAYLRIENTADPKLRLKMERTGDVDVTTVSSGGVWLPDDGDRVWIRAKLVFSTGMVSFYYSTESTIRNHNSVTWTQIGSDVDSGDTTAMVDFGANWQLILGNTTAVGTDPMLGKVFAGAIKFDNVLYGWNYTSNNDTNFTVGPNGSYVAPVAWSFTPDTFQQSLYIGESTAARRLWRRMNWRNAGYNVLITGGVASASPGVTSPTTDALVATASGSGEGGKAWFRGGQTYSVTGTENTILTTAGYTVT